MAPRGRPPGSGGKRKAKPPPPPAPYRRCDKILNVLEHIRSEPINQRFLSKWLPDTLWTRLLNLHKALLGHELTSPQPLNMTLQNDETYKDGLSQSHNETGIFCEIYCNRAFYCILPKKETQGVQMQPLPLESENSEDNEAKREPTYQIKRPLFCHSWMQQTLALAETLSFGLPSLGVLPPGVQPLSTPVQKPSNQPSKKRPLPEEILNASYWESTEAKRLFRPKPEDGSVEAALKRRIELLRQANLDKDGWKKVILGGDPYDLCTDSDRHSIRQRSQLLCLAYSIALEKMGRKTWGECSAEAIDILKCTGNVIATCTLSFGRWNKIFCEQEAWDHPRRSSAGSRAPKLFKLYPQLIKPFRTFMMEHLHCLSIDLGMRYVRHNLLPPFIEEMRNKEETKEEFANIYTPEDLCLHHSLKVGVSKAMLAKMFDFLGFAFCDKAHGYQVEGRKRGYWIHKPSKDATIKQKTAEAS